MGRMTTTAPVPLPTNVEVGQRIGLSHSGVSRIRSGDRVPSLARMRDIEREYGWALVAQIESQEKGRYAEDFEDVLTSSVLPAGHVGL